MKKLPKYNRALFAVSLTIAFSGALGWNQTARAELVRQQVQEDAITPESQDLPSSDTAALAQAAASTSAPDQDTEVVIVKKKKPKRRVIIQEEDDSQPAPVAQAAAPAAPAPVYQAVPAAPAAPAEAPKSAGIGGAIDSSINTKMDGVKQQFEEKIVKMLDHIKITVDSDEQPAAPAQTAAAPLTQAVVQDNLAMNSAAPASGYTTVDQAPSSGSADGESVKSKDDEDVAPIKGKVSVFPLVGITSISSSTYNIDARYTAGVGMEVEVADNLTIVGTYSYSSYNIGLGSTNSLYGYTSAYGYGLNNLQYNQNLFDIGARYYLMPKTSRLRLFVGAGVGYNKGYVNYNQSTLNTYGAAQYGGQYGQFSDYDVTSEVGHIEAGADVQLSKSVSIGASVKYDTVLSSNQNQPLNNYGFINNNGTVTNPPTASQASAGGSISQDGFYSILANLKVSF